MGKPNPIVLYVEDEEADRFLMKRAFAKEGLGPVLRTVDHGGAAIEYLSSCGQQSSGAGAGNGRASAAASPAEDLVEPAVVLLDLNLPEVHGFDVLKWIRAHPAHTSLPVVVFTSSAREDDRERAKILGATEYLTKPSSIGGFQEVARELGRRWLGKVES